MDDGTTAGSLLELSNYINPGSVSLLLFAIGTGAWGKWVFGWIYDAKCKESDAWKELALKGTEQAQRILKEVA